MLNVAIHTAAQQPVISTIVAAKEIIAAAISNVLPQKAIEKFVQLKNNYLAINGATYNLKAYNNIVVIATGKAAAGMAKAIETILGDNISTGICVTKYGHSLPLKYCSIIEAAHPIPDENSVLATASILAIVKKCDDQSLVLFLLSGGASSLMADVPNGCNLQEVQQLFQQLVLSKASINEINVVRKKISKVKGGKLALSMPNATIHTLIISDVPNNDLSTIGSGPTVIKSSVSEVSAKAILESYYLWNNVSDNLKKEIENISTENEAVALVHNKHTIIASSELALQAAKIKAAALNYNVISESEILNDDLPIAIEKIRATIKNNLLKKSTVLLFGGEITLQVTSNNFGGRNQHLALCLLKEVLQLNTQKAITIAVSGTDGTDGNTQVNGALISNKWHYNLQEMEQAIVACSSFNFFKKFGGHIITGATQTNVMDIVIVFITD